MVVEKNTAKIKDGMVEVHLDYFDEYIKYRQAATEWKYRAYGLLGIIATFAAILLGIAIAITVGVI